MIKDANTDIDKHLSCGKNILLVWEGRNDMILNKSTPKQAYENLKSYCLERKSKGWKVIVFTSPVSFDFNYKGLGIEKGNETLFYETQALNNLIRNGYKEFADAIVNFKDDSGFMNFGDNNYIKGMKTRPSISDNEIFVDGTHLSTKAHNKIGELAKKEIVNIL